MSDAVNNDAERDEQPYFVPRAMLELLTEKEGFRYGPRLSSKGLDVGWSYYGVAVEFVDRLD